MRRRCIQLIAVVPLLVGVRALSGCGGQGAESRALARASATPSGTRCQVVGSIPYWAQDEAMESHRDQLGSVDTLAMFWYHLDPRGKVLEYERARADRELIERAHEHGVNVLALVANLPDDEREGGGLTWDAERVARVIELETSRERHIAELLTLTRRMGFDGILIDYEALPAQYRGEFTLLIQQLGAALRNEGKILAVALHPKTSENDPSENNGSWAQDWAALYEHADQLHFMTYSQHTAQTPPGPVAALGWVRSVLRYAVEDVGVPPSKVYMGLPLYAEEWRKQQDGTYRGSDEDLTFSDVQERRQEHGGEQAWSREHGGPTLIYRDEDGGERVIWFENGRSSTKKLSMARGFGVCNVALWRLGGEDPALWQALRASALAQ